MTAQVSPSRLELLIGYSAIITLLISQCAASSFVQALRGSIPDFELSTLRALAQMLCYALIIVLSKKSFKVQKTFVPALLCLGSLLAIYNVGYYGSTNWIPLVTAAGILYPSSILATMLQGRLVFQLDIKKMHIIGVFICIAGIILVTQPPLLFGGTARQAHTNANANASTCANTSAYGNANANASKNVYANANISTYANVHTNAYPSAYPSTYPNATSGALINSSYPLRNETRNTEPASNPMTSPSSLSSSSSSSASQIMGIIMAAVGGAAAGCLFDITAISLSQVPPVLKACYMSATCLLVSACVCLYCEQIVWRMTPLEVLLTAGHCLGSVANTLSSVYASHLLGGARVSFALCLSVVLMLVSQYTIMRDIMPGHRNWPEVLGAFVIIVGVGLPSGQDVLMRYRKSDVLL